MPLKLQENVEERKIARRLNDFVVCMFSERITICDKIKFVFALGRKKTECVEGWM